MNWNPTFDPGRRPVLPEAASGFDAGQAHPARIYTHWLGGKDTFAADRRVAQEVAAKAPWVVAGARGNRAFLTRAISYLARSGVRQYLDIGAGLPAAGNVHEIAGRLAPGSKVVYVDHDPIVLAHARALLATDAHTIAVHGDARNPHAILADPAVRAHLDVRRPIAVLFVAILHFITDQDGPGGIVAAFREALTPGSHLVISHVADLPDHEQPSQRAAATREAAQLYNDLAGPFTLRTPEQLATLFDGFDLLAPGLVPANLWRPSRLRPDAAIPVLAGVGILRGPEAGSSAHPHAGQR